MKVQPISNQNYNRNTSFHGVSKICKYGVGSLIASTSLFMLSNALDSFKSENINKQTVTCLNTIASILGIAGTGMGMFGIEQSKNNKE